MNNTDFYTILTSATGLAITLILFIISFRLQKHSRILQKLQLWKEYRNPIIQFSENVIEVLHEAIGLCDDDPARSGDQFRKERNKIIIKLSTYLDKGKVIIPDEYKQPNYSKQTSSQNRLGATALNCIKTAISVVKTVDYKEFAHNRFPTKDENHIQYQGIARSFTRIKTIDLKAKEENKETFKGWSCQKAIIVLKKQFIKEIHTLVDVEEWQMVMSEQTEVKKIIN